MVELVESWRTYPIAVGIAEVGKQLRSTWWGWSTLV